MIRLLLLLSLLYSSENQYFKVEFFGIPVAEVKLDISDTIYNNQNSKLITVQTNSISLTKYIFNVDNYYETITSDNLRTILSFSKKTSQPKVINNIKTSVVNDTIYYDDSLISIPNNYFNIFSLLYFLSINKITSPQNINIEREGLLYSGIITPIHISDKNTISYTLDLKENNAFTHKSIVENTDIFTWALFKEKSQRYITVNYDNNDILECVFKNGMIKIYAKNIKYFN